MQAFLQRASVAFLPFLVALTFHEYAHGWVANRWGDTTAKDSGRLTLNPLPHIDFLGTIVFPLITMATGFGFGWARPVPIDPRRFRKYRPALFMVSIAGVTMNFILAVLGAALLCGIHTWVPETFYLYQPLKLMALLLVQLNFSLGVFNLLPFPPLDGSKIIESMLPLAAARKFEEMARFSAVLLLLLMFTGALRVLVIPIEFLTDTTIGLMAMLFKIT